MARKKAKKTGTTKGKKKDVLIVASKVKAYMHSKNMNTSAEAIGCLSQQVYNLLDAAVERTKANGRKTVKPQDI
jgi:histone H3/H4